MADSRLDEFSRDLMEVMPEVARGFLRREASELSKGLLTPPQLVVLVFLRQRGKARMSDIARHLSITTAAVTGIVDRLVKCDYVKRVYDESDRRTIFVILAPQGNSLVTNVMAQKSRVVREVFGNISAGDRETFLRILTRIKEVLSQ